MVKYLIFSFMLWLVFDTEIQSSKGQFQNCDNLSISVKTTPVEGGKNGSVEVKVSGGKDPIYYIVYLPSGKPLKNDATSNSIKDLAQGNYFCSIVDGSGCTKKIEFKIE